MNYRRDAVRTIIAFSALVALGCTDSPAPSEPNGMSPSYSRSSTAQDRLAALFPETSAEVLSMPGTVYADHDEVRGKLVFGIHNQSAAAGIRRSLEARGLSADEFEIKAAEPIEMMTLQTSIVRPTQAGTQIHFGNYVCTLGFNVTHSGGRSFITNSHCTNTQGGVEGTVYNQPDRTRAPTKIATEVADPTYTSSGCSAGKLCRSSDASRALYEGAAESAQGVIARPPTKNSGDLSIAGTFTITSQDNSSTNYSGEIHKVGRTTGWTSGTVSGTCVTINVSQTKFQQKCQTLVTNNNATIVSGGDSGSPVFKLGTNNEVQLVGILWGGGGTTQFVFSPLKNIQDEMGAVDAVYDGGTTSPPPPPPPPPAPCKPRGPKNPCP